MQMVIQNAVGEVTGSLVSHSDEIEIQLTAHELFKLSGDTRDVQISAVGGHLWVTQQGDPTDYLLRPGEQMVLSRKGAVLIQGLSKGRARMALTRNSRRGKVGFLNQPLSLAVKRARNQESGPYPCS